MDILSDDHFVGRFSLSIAGDEDRTHIYRIRHAVYARELHQHSENERGELTDALDPKMCTWWRNVARGYSASSASRSRPDPIRSTNICREKVGLRLRGRGHTRFDC